MAYVPSLISLYSGAGGLDKGFIDAGFRIDWAIDSDEDAVATYRKNLGPQIVCGTLPQRCPPVGLCPDLVIGGPPCQGFSVAGHMDPSDARSRHVRHLINFAARHKARGFVLENVKALARGARWQRTREGLLRLAERHGYVPYLLVLNATDFGVPQARERAFLIGLRRETDLGLHRVNRPKPISVREALAALPRYGEPGNDSICKAQVVPARRPVLRPSPYRGSLLFNGSGRPLALDEPAKTLPASMGGNATPIIDQAELVGDADPWVVSYHQRLLHGGKPTSRAPRSMRRLTVEEAAILQSFSPGWRFAGGQNSRYRQIGNAVPPKLAHAVARAVRRALDAD
jgi:DNA (cytosine-5)-methyltransferase 1